MVMRNRALLALVASLIAVPLAGANAKDFEQSGIASIYMYGRPVMTASGARTNDAGLNAAHKSLPFGTMVKVTNRRNGQSVVVKVIDRGPYIRGRIIDVTPAAAKALGFWGAGVTPVTLAVVGRG
jgi:peptidoglycan lytic transglycosylase